MSRMFRLALETVINNKIDYNIENASLTDINSVLKFQSEMVNETNNNLWNDSKDDLLTHLDWCSKRQPNLFLIAKYKKEIIGYLILYDFNNTKDYAFIAKLAVSTKYRKLGIGKALLDKTIIVCKNSNVKFIELIVEKDNVAGIQWYTKNGFKYKQISKGGLLFVLELKNVF